MKTAQKILGTRAIRVLAGPWFFYPQSVEVSLNDQFCLCPSRSFMVSEAVGCDSNSLTCNASLHGVFHNDYFQSRYFHCYAPGLFVQEHIVLGLSVCQYVCLQTSVIPVIFLSVQTSLPITGSENVWDMYVNAVYSWRALTEVQAYSTVIIVKLS